MQLASNRHQVKL